MGSLPSASVYILRYLVRVRVRVRVRVKARVRVRVRVRVSRCASAWRRLAATSACAAASACGHRIGDSEMGGHIGRGHSLSSRSGYLFTLGDKKGGHRKMLRK